eukprot:UN09557
MYQEHDNCINVIVTEFNGDKERCCGATNHQITRTDHPVTNLDPNLVKSLLIQETGGSAAAWPIDPAQVNVPGDWNQYKKDVHLTRSSRRNQGTIFINLRAAVMYLCRKGFGRSGQPARNRPDGYFDGWEESVRRYNGRSDVTTNGRPYSENYRDRIFDRKNNCGKHYRIVLPATKPH